MENEEKIEIQNETPSKGKEKLTFNKKEIIWIIVMGILGTLAMGGIFTYGSMTTYNQRHITLYNKIVSLINEELKEKEEKYQINKLASFSYEEHKLQIGAYNQENFLSYTFDFTKAKSIPKDENKLIEVILKSSYKERKYESDYFSFPLIQDTYVNDSLSSIYDTSDTKNINYVIGQDEENTTDAYYACTFLDNTNHYISFLQDYNFASHSLDIGDITSYQGDSKVMNRFFAYIISNK